MRSSINLSVTNLNSGDDSSAREGATNRGRKEVVKREEQGKRARKETRARKSSSMVADLGIWKQKR